MKPSAFTTIMKTCEKNAIESQSSVFKCFFSQNLFFGFPLYKLHNVHTDKKEQHHDEAEIDSFLALCDTIWLSVIV